MTFTTTISGAVLPPSIVLPNSAPAQNATVNTAVGAPPSVKVTDANSTPLGNVAVTFAVTSGGGSITGPATVQTNAAGVATVGGWTVGQIVGPNTLTATVTGLTPVTFTATGTAGAPASVVGHLGYAADRAGGVGARSAAGGRGAGRPGQPGAGR